MPNRGMEHHKSAVFCQKALIPDWAKAMLDAAYAEAGRLDEATTVAEEARSLALSAGDRELADLATARLQLYRTGKPYHQER